MMKESIAKKQEEVAVVTERFKNSAAVVALILLQAVLSLLFDLISGLK